MIKITLKDGSWKEINRGSTVLEAAEGISAGLARNATAGEVNGKTVDLRFALNEDCGLNILTFEDQAGKQAYWHTTSHIMAHAVKRLFPEIKLAIGPSIESGFYYDFDVEKPFSPEQLEKIEKEMNNIIKEDLPLERFTLSREEALKMVEGEGEIYKAELIRELPQDAVISFYRQGDFTDLCAGPHLMSTGIVTAF